MFDVLSMRTLLIVIVQWRNVFWAFYYGFSWCSYFSLVSISFSIVQGTLNWIEAPRQWTQPPLLKCLSIVTGTFDRSRRIPPQILEIFDGSATVCPICHLNTYIQEVEVEEPEQVAERDDLEIIEILINWMGGTYLIGLSKIKVTHFTMLNG